MGWDWLETNEVQTSSSITLRFFRKLLRDDHHIFNTAQRSKCSVSINLSSAVSNSLKHTLWRFPEISFFPVSILFSRFLMLLVILFWSFFMFLFSYPGICVSICWFGFVLRLSHGIRGLANWDVKGIKNFLPCLSQVGSSTLLWSEKFFKFFCLIRPWLEICLIVHT